MIAASPREDALPSGTEHRLAAAWAEVLAIPAEAFAAVARTTKRIAAAVERALNPGGLSLVQANGKTIRIEDAEGLARV